MTEKISADKLRLIFGLLLALLIPMLLGKFIPIAFKAFSYNLSISLKQILLLLLPFIIFSFVFSCLLSFHSGALKLVFALICCVFLSNLITIFIGYSFGGAAISMLDLSHTKLADLTSEIHLTWALQFPLYVQNKHGLLLGFILGTAFSAYRHAQVELFAEKCNLYAHKFLKNIFIPILPIFILGFVFKLEQDRLLSYALESFAPIFLIVVGLQVSWVFTTYMIANAFNFGKAIDSLKNVLPATVTGFSTISSAASLPVLILCSEKNTDPKYVDTILPATINTHTLGSAIGVTVLTISIAKMFGLEVDFFTFLNFAILFAFTKFSVAAVPGGVIVAVLPLLEQYIGFSPDMLGLITAMYFMFDPFGTAANVTANGSFVIFFTRLAKKFID